MTSPDHHFFRASAADFKKIPGSPIAYWVGHAGFSVYKNYVGLKSRSKAVTGMRTGDNERFLRRWQEVEFGNVGIGFTKSNACSSGRKWFPYNKGGEYTKWYGNNELLVNWKEDGEEIKELTRKTYPQLGDNLGWKITNEELYFKHGITWGGLTSASVSFRWSDSGALFDSNKGAMMFPSGSDRYSMLGFLNSSVVRFLLNAINPTLSTQNCDIDNIPMLLEEFEKKSFAINKIVECILNISKVAEKSIETSWDFSDFPMLRPHGPWPFSDDRKEPEIVFRSSEKQPIKGATLAESWENWRTFSQAMISRMKELEEENNRIWIEAYGLQDELSPEVPLKEITLTCNPWYRYSSDNKSEAQLWKLARADAARELLSYAVGCMMGRYSLSKPGLILANQGEGVEEYLKEVRGQSSEVREGDSDPSTLTSDLSFLPDEDGILPVLDGEWFADDVVVRTREFLRVTFGEGRFQENLNFLEEALGTDLRSYFVKEFYKVHIGGDRGCGYKKRPIYWLFQSPKKGFQALVYLHRYNRDTVNTLLNRYLRPYLGKLEDRIRALDHEQATAEGKGAQTAARKEQDQLRKTHKECQAWERDVIYPLAQQRIEIDLDDGVKTNYPKFGDALAKIPGLS